MAIEKEIEYKQLLNEDEYNQLLAAYFSDETSFTQVNYYIDTENLDLLNQLLALRIREKNGNYEMTLKVPAEVGLTEFNFRVDEKPEIDAAISEDQLPKDISNKLKAHDIDLSALKVLGSLETKRYETRHQDNLIVLDQSTYLDQQDFELEYEVVDAVKGYEAFQAILKAFDITHEIPDNKVKRFFDRKKALLK
ncbi:CYTH domain-containing protein [Staphylococcus massiliensis]|uniref:CYTH domain-containing protein n=1 Tax=Staphylococcus massiliensis S46 TaxID=1229783 RepID=K9ALC5_9STAP|nr:CYTH domain-containing protein [Staphylococcus massiliensis]EKU48099.1 hypothetical protein C273_06553 [Staphylococcus massiliensis S46]MCG3399855.1 CYTH domain-containing protein [Staphylococcus massiliensis]MCG3412126.1 CYTH domain-containing protein [Staphylococcus massiliensis]PNZ98226.1 CYTH domain-containing protein [Staphylococcus massiliensis CCUG 55927]